MGHPGQGLGRKLAKWLTFSLTFALLPVSFDIIIRSAQHKAISPSDLFAGGAGFLIGFGISASGLGELLFDKKQQGYLALSTIAAIVFSAFILIVGALYYALSKAPGNEVGELAAWIYLAIATTTAFTSVCISA